VGNRKLYISAVQAPFIKAIDTRLLPKCALINKARDAGKSYPCK
jgi:hypothetical protein